MNKHVQILLKKKCSVHSKTRGFSESLIESIILGIFRRFKVFDENYI